LYKTNYRKSKRKIRFDVKMFKKTIEKLKKFWEKNINKNYKKISAAFGALLIFMMVTLGVPLSLLFTGGVPDWGLYLSNLYSAFAGGFFTVLILGFFGKEEEVNKTEENK